MATLIVVDRDGVELIRMPMTQSMLPPEPGQPIRLPDGTRAVFVKVAFEMKPDEMVVTGTVEPPDFTFRVTCLDGPLAGKVDAWSSTGKDRDDVVPGFGVVFATGQTAHRYRVVDRDGLDLRLAFDREVNLD